MASYIQIFTRKERLLQAWNNIKKKYGFGDDGLKQFIWDIIEELANNESFYKAYIRKMAEKVEKGEAVNPKRLLLDLMFNKQ
jgi:hypothetical protein